MLSTESQMKKAAATNRRGKKEFQFTSEAHKRRVNDLTLMYFNGNYRVRPTAQSIFAFSQRAQPKWLIREFLNNVELQQDYNF